MFELQTYLYATGHKFHFILFFIFSYTAPQCGLWPPRSRGFLITHNDAPQSVELLWTSDQLVAETSTWQHTTNTTDKHPCPGGIRTHDPSRKAAVDLHLRPRSHWDNIHASRDKICVINTTNYSRILFRNTLIKNKEE
jgi:hypothetical protein